jgi:hypothetical protein
MPGERKSYELAFKKAVIERVEKEGKHAVAKDLKIDRKRLREWCAQKEKIETMMKQSGEEGRNGKKKRLAGKFSTY